MSTLYPNISALVKPSKLSSDDKYEKIIDELTKMYISKGLL
jgi:hypothetical protein